MPRIKRVFVEFGGDPSDDKECYKRYTATSPFKPCLFNAEVLECIPIETIKESIQEAFRKNSVWNPTAETIFKELGIE